MRDSDAEAASAEAREEEIRQLLEAKAYRQQSRGQAPIDVDRELDRLLTEEEAAVPRATTPSCARRCASWSSPATSAASARARSRSTSSAEVDRQLRELENLGQ